MKNFIASTNLITDLKFKQSVGMKADALDEALAVINQGLEKLGNSEENGGSNLAIAADARENYQINVKLFLRGFDPEAAVGAVNQTLEALGTYLQSNGKAEPTTKLNCHFRNGKDRLFDRLPAGRRHGQSWNSKAHPGSRIWPRGRRGHARQAKGEPEQNFIKMYIGNPSLTKSCVLFKKSQCRLRWEKHV